MKPISQLEHLEKNLRIYEREPKKWESEIKETQREIFKLKGKKEMIFIINEWFNSKFKFQKENIYNEEYFCFYFKEKHNINTLRYDRKKPSLVQSFKRVISNINENLKNQGGEWFTKTSPELFLGHILIGKKEVTKLSIPVFAFDNDKDIHDLLESRINSKSKPKYPKSESEEIRFDKKQNDILFFKENGDRVEITFDSSKGTRDIYDSYNERTITFKPNENIIKYLMNRFGRYKLYFESSNEPLNNKELIKLGL